MFKDLFLVQNSRLNFINSRKTNKLLKSIRTLLGKLTDFIDYWKKSIELKYKLKLNFVLIDCLVVKKYIHESSFLVV